MKQERSEYELETNRQKATQPAQVAGQLSLALASAASNIGNKRKEDD